MYSRGILHLEHRILTCEVHFQCVAGSMLKSLSSRAPASWSSYQVFMSQGKSCSASCAVKCAAGVLGMAPAWTVRGYVRSDRDGLDAGVVDATGHAEVTPFC